MHDRSVKIAKKREKLWNRVPKKKVSWDFGEWSGAAKLWFYKKYITNYSREIKIVEAKNVGNSVDAKIVDSKIVDTKIVHALN